MKRTSRMAKIFLTCGLVGILAVILTIICDFILIGRPNSTYSFLKLGTESMHGLSQWRIFLGTFLGIIVLPLQIAGLVPVYYGLKPAGKVKSLIVVLIAGHAAVMASAFHISYAFIASGWKLYHTIGPENIAASEMLKSFGFYWKTTIIIMAVDLILSSILYILLIMNKNTLYPKWMALLNPASILLYTFIMILPIPNPIGGFVAPAFLNISTLIFFTFSTFIVYVKLK
ncbi:MAG: hypothetical protein K0R54_2025 [Clostridiaceae bacterium]|jgi:hypothetical protein|nr:hypothetical protein [Clostridiaceae bacterium]